MTQKQRTDLIERLKKDIARYEKTKKFYFWDCGATKAEKKEFGKKHSFRHVYEIYECKFAIVVDINAVYRHPRVLKGVWVDDKWKDIRFAKKILAQLENGGSK